MLPPDHPAIILFDGQCNLCNRSIRFIIKRDPNEHFRFASLQSDIGRRLLEQHGATDPSLATMVLIENARVYARSAASLRIARGLRFPWPILWSLILIPRPLRDAIYNFIARHRYRWFGRSETCTTPAPEISRRFLSESTT